jgi:KUP system potassium uptake protein
VLLHYFKHSKVLHQNVILFTVENQRVPKVPAERMVEVRPLGEGFWQLIARVGFMQDPDVPAILDQASRLGLAASLDDVSYYLGRETLLTGGRAPMARWRKALFAFLSRNARPATQFFHLPPNRVVEIGAQIEL